MGKPIEPSRLFIPLSKPGDTTRHEDSFLMEVTSPSGRAGPMYGRISDIE